MRRFHKKRHPYFTECYRCNKKEKLHRCRYCGNFFCSECVKARLAGMPNFRDNSPEARDFRESLHETGGHPCVPFYDHWIAERKKKDEAYGAALNNILSRPSSERTPYFSHRKSFDFGKALETIFKLAFFALIVYLLYVGFQSGKIESFFSNTTEKVGDWWESQSSNDDSAITNVKNFAEGIIDPKSQIPIPALEKEIHRLINGQRSAAGLSALSWDDKLASIARAHSEDMVKNSFFSHDNLAGQDPTARASSQGYSCRKDYGSYYTYGIAENIAQNAVHSNVIGCGSTTTLERLANCIVNGWMLSTGHRQNILTSTYSKEGIGAAYGPGNEVLVTQDFC